MLFEYIVKMIIKHHAEKILTIFFNKTVCLLFNFLIEHAKLSISVPW